MLREVCSGLLNERAVDREYLKKVVRVIHPFFVFPVFVDEITNI